MKRENQIGARVSFPSSFFMELEDCWKYESGGCHRALTFQDFLNMLVGYGLETYKAKNLPQVEEASAEEAPDPADADLWDFPAVGKKAGDKMSSVADKMSSAGHGKPAEGEVWDFPRNNRRPLLRFGGEQ